VGPADVLQDAHAVGHLPGGAAKVDRLAAGPQRGCLLDHGRLEAVAVQPVRQRGPGDAGAGDEDLVVDHRRTASGVSLAAIGYHFGSKEALLNAARIEAIGEWADELGRALASDSDPDATPLERFEAIWARVIEAFDPHRALWTASFEMLAQLDHAPEVRKAVADALRTIVAEVGPVGQGEARG
jgi:hypothetical protein